MNNTNSLLEKKNEAKDLMKLDENKSLINIDDSSNKKNLIVAEISSDKSGNTTITTKTKTATDTSKPKSKNTDETKSRVKNKKNFLVIISTFFAFLITISLVIFGGFTVYNLFNTNIISGVSIKDIDVSGLSPSDAKYQLDNYLESNIPEEITVKHGDFETTISLSQMDVKFDTKTATNLAFKVGRTGNIFENNLSVLSTMFGNVNIAPIITLDEESLSKNLQDMSAQLPDAVVQSSYYIEGNELLITPGKEGNVVDVENTIKNIKDSIYSFDCVNNPIEIVVKPQAPDDIDVEKIYNEVKKDPVDAYYTTNPFSVYPSENGIDFNISLDDAKALVVAEKKDEYSIPLKYIYPNVTTNMIGTEAFPDLLSTYATRYSTYDRNRSTNLVLAGNKINGTVLMPGETFSYNKVVGARTIAAGYREASMYLNGQVVDGVGGGICQISSTLYNAAVLANLEIVQRTNHMFVSSYVPISRDATVSYGSIDFQFKNNRNYPIKLVCSVSGGIATFQIFGMKQENDCEVQISSYQTGSTSTAIYSVAYKILKRNGAVVGKELLSKDTYRKH